MDQKRIERAAHKRRLIFNFISYEINTNGVAPTIQEIGAQIGLSSTASVHAHLRALEQDGLITRGRGHRAILLKKR
jgi:repressor LexA